MLQPRAKAMQRAPHDAAGSLSLSFFLLRAWPLPPALRDAKLASPPRAVSSQNSVLDSLSPTTRKLLFGYLAGLCAETAIYPLDTVRRRQQAFGAASPLGRHNVLSGGCPSTRVAARLRCDRSCCCTRPVGIYIRDARAPRIPSPPRAEEKSSRSLPPAPTLCVPAALVFVFRSEGVMGMFKGLSLNLFKNPIATAVSFSVNDLVKDTLMKRRAIAKDS